MHQERTLLVADRRYLVVPLWHLHSHLGGPHVPFPHNRVLQAEAFVLVVACHLAGVVTHLAAGQVQKIELVVSG